MKKFWQMLVGITREAWCAICFYAVSSVYIVGIVVGAALPYVMYAVGQYAALSRGSVGFGGEVAIPVLVGIVVYYMKAIGNKSGKGRDMPVPAKRFTTVDDDGEVTVERARVDEMILYVADVEDYLARRGML